VINKLLSRTVMRYEPRPGRRHEARQGAQRLPGIEALARPSAPGDRIEGNGNTEWNLYKLHSGDQVAGNGNISR
jgi:hypothetical protein